MKAIWTTILSLALVTPAFAWLKTASFVVKVEDELGAPVSNAVVTAGFYRDKTFGDGPGSKVNAIIEKITDTNGICTVAGRCNGRVGGNVQKTGYYKSYLPDIIVTNVSLSKFYPWNAQYEVVLRAVENPVPMCAKRLWRAIIPANGAPLGYDLMKGDWLPPHGRGETADFIFQLDCKFGGKRPSDNGQMFESTFTLTFSNEGDGIQEADGASWPGSVFRLPRYAPEDGYASNWCEKGYRNEHSSSRSQERDYFFRVRTKKDDKGRIVSALHGKIRKSLDAEVVISGTPLHLLYYLNPTPNDRNMEFDPKRNLIADLTDFEEVREP